MGTDPSMRRPERERKRRQAGSSGGADEDDLEYRLALEASKNEADEERKRREAGSRPVAPPDDDLAKAIKLSKEEEELRRLELEEQNAASLFDDTPAQTNQPQATGWNQGYQQQGAVDWFGNPVDQQQPQSTGFLNNAYAQPSGMQPQQTGFYNPYQQQPQTTGFDQPQYQQQSFLQPQQTALNMNNPYSQQSGGFGQQQPQQQPQEQPMQSGSQNPWSSDNSHANDSIKPQATGSNNPFASSFNRPQTTIAQRQPTLSTLQEQKTQSPFSQPINHSAIPPMPPMPFATQQSTQPLKEVNPHHAQLNALLSTGDGQDTFGNTGNMRIPAQHTAPGTFVNSAGSGINRLPTNPTGNNPFLHNQFTGMQPQNQMMPAQTGPAGAFGGGFGSSNPFGGSQQRQQQQQQPGGSLIDL